MAERQTSKPEIAAQKRVVKLPPAIGDWTTYKPPKLLVKKVKTGLYGFDRLSKEELNQVILIHYRFIQDFLKHLQKDLGMAVELFSVQAEQTAYLNFLRNLTGPVVQCKIDLPGVHDSIFLFLDLPLANSIINHALGSVDMEPINRGLTESENTVLSTTLAEYLPAFSSAFMNAVGNPSLSIVSSPDTVIDSTVNPSSTFASFSALTSLADNPPGKIMIAYPGNALKKILAKYRQIDRSKPLDFSGLTAELLAKISSPLCATLGETSLTTEEIQQLEAGDVVSLDTSIASPVPATVGDILKLLCQAGTRNKKSAIRVLGLKESAGLELPPPELAEIKKEAGEAKPVEEKIEAPEGPAEEEKPPEEVPAEEEAEEEFPEEETFEEEEEEEEEFPEDFLEEEL
jgi:flagellar motor switch protein FliM